MKILLGILLLINAALLMWGMGERQFIRGSDSPAAEYHPELMQLQPPEVTGVPAKVTISSSGESVTTNGMASSTASSGSQDVLPAPEVPKDAAVTANDMAQEAAARMMASILPGQCMLIGPYKTEIERGRGGRKLSDMKIKFSDREDPRGRILGYRVYQGPFVSKLEVSSARRRLKKQGVKDLYLMNEGKNKRYISLGFFSSENSSDSFMEDFSKRKIKTNKRIEYGINYWLLVQKPEAIKKLVKKSSIPIQPGATKKILPCSAVRW